MPRIDLLELVRVQRAERYRAAIIHAPAMAGKTRTARALAQALPDATYLDIAESLAGQPDFAARIDRFGPEDLEHFLLGIDVPGQVVIVDHLDPILNTWTRTQRMAFAQWVDDGLDGQTDNPSVFLFFIQTDQDISDYNMQRRNRLGRTRVFWLDEFNAL